TALDTPGRAFSPPLDGSLSGLRVALSTDLGGVFEVDDQVAAIVEAQAVVLEDAGAHVEHDHLDVTGAEQVFRTLRAWMMQSRYGSMLAKRPDGFKASLADNIRAGESLSGSDIAAAYQRMTSLGDKVRRFFEVYDVLVMPVSQVPPFDAEVEYPTTINGRTQETYLDWMRSAFLITVTGCPAISLPAGFTREGWPVGIQVVAAPHAERRLLEIAHAFEQLTRVGERRPALDGA
ncbi:MAG: amidase family protein, partial [Nocardioides sp.]